jgi:hypothetical protein
MLSCCSMKWLYPCRYQTTIPELYKSSFIHYEMHTALTHTELNQIKHKYMKHAVFLLLLTCLMYVNEENE